MDDHLARVARSSPAIRFKSVVLPEPDGPMSARNSPSSTLRSSPTKTGIRNSSRRYSLSTPREHDRGHPGHGRIEPFALWKPPSVGDPDGFVVAEGLERVEHDRLARLEARLDPRQRVGRGRHLDRPLQDHVLGPDDPDEVVAVLRENGRLCSQDKRAVAIATCFGLVG